MQPQLIRKDGTSFALTDEQYQQVLETLGLEDASPRIPLTPEAAQALLDQVQIEASTVAS